MIFGSLFAGVGGLDLGLERAGMECAWQCEIAKRPNEILGYHWPNVRRFPDVTKPPADLAPVDLLCGGFPCQDVSVAGNRSGLAGEKSGLFWSFVDLARELSPEWVLLENVPGLLNSNGPRDLGAVLGALGQLGYRWAYRTLDSRYFGVPQRRRRVFILGHRGAGGKHPGEVLFEAESVPGNSSEMPSQEKEITATFTRKSSQGGSVDASGAIGGFLRPVIFDEAKPNDRLTLCWNWRQQDFSPGPISPPLDADGSGSIAVATWLGVRKILPVEAERLQGFPDGWTAMGTKGPIADSPRYSALGNAVSVPVAEWIGRRIMEAR